MKILIAFFKQINIISVEEELFWIHIFNMYIYTLPLKSLESSLMLKRLHLFDQNEIKTVENYKNVKYCN